MSKFLFVIPPFWGHINPTLSIGGTLLERGHDVAWAGMTKLNMKLFPLGAKYFYMEKTVYIIIEKGSSFYLKSIPFRKDFQRT